MSPRHACDVWVQYDAGGPWHKIERPARYGKQLPPLTEREAVREAEEFRSLGYRAKALPLGTKPEEKP
jgi:hypothetical protein